MKYYKKDGQVVGVHDKFIYLSEIYKYWKNGASLIEEKYIQSNKPIVLTKKQKVSKDLRRYFELKFAPEDYLIKNNYYETRRD
jgi:hypothetical protein